MCILGLYNSFSMYYILGLYNSFSMYYILGLHNSFSMCYILGCILSGGIRVAVFTCLYIMWGTSESFHFISSYVRQKCILLGINNLM